MSIDNFFTIDTTFGNNIKVVYSPQKKNSNYDYRKKYDAYKKDDKDIANLFRNAFRIVPLDGTIRKTPYDVLATYFKLNGYNLSQPYTTNVTLKDISLDTYNMTEARRANVFIKGMTRENTENVYNKNPNVIDFSIYGKKEDKYNFIRYNKRPDKREPIVISMDYNTPKLPGGIQLKTVA